MAQQGRHAARPPASPATRPPMKPDQVLLGEKRGHSLGPSSSAADREGADVGRPGDREQQQRPARRPASRRRAARSAADAGRRDVEHAVGRVGAGARRRRGRTAPAASGADDQQRPGQTTVAADGRGTPPASTAASRRPRPRAPARAARSSRPIRWPAGAHADQRSAPGTSQPPTQTAATTARDQHDGRGGPEAQVATS